MPALLRTTSLVLFTLIGVFLVAFGILYASVTQMLWFHAAAVPEAVRPQVHSLYIALMKLIGGSSVALGLLGLYVVYGPLRRGFPGAATALLITLSLPVVMAAVVAEILAHATGAPTSWHIMGVLLAITGAAYVAHIASRRATMTGIGSAAPAMGSASPP